MDNLFAVPKVSVIIPNLNGEKLLPACLEGVKRCRNGSRSKCGMTTVQEHGRDAHATIEEIEIILVDNGSSDNSIQVAKSIIDDIEIVSLSANLGFAGAVKRGIEESKGQYIALLNNDAIPEPGWIEAMLQAMESAPSIGMVACRILNQDGTLIDSLGLGAARNGMAVLIGHGKPIGWKSPFPEPFGPSGAAGMYRREMLDQLGGFPERFFCYYEDLWVAWQGRLRGWRCILADTAVVRHLGQGTPFQGWKNRNYWITLNKWRTIVSCWNSTLFIRHAPRHLFWELLILFGDMISGQFIQGLASRTKAILELGYWLRIRKITLAKKLVSGQEIRSWLIPSPSLWELIGRRFR
jgi:GT2 family glycosyltransferase